MLLCFEKKVVSTFLIYYHCLFLSWKTTAHKNALARGEPTTDNKGRPIPARETGPDCSCKRECFDLVNGEERRHALTNINDMVNRDLQNLFLRGLIIGKEPQRLGTSGCKGVNKPGKEKKRSLVYEYFVQTSDLNRIQVCGLEQISVTTNAIFMRNL